MTARAARSPRVLASLALACLLVWAGACGQPRRGPSLPVQARASRVDVFFDVRTGVQRGVGFELGGLTLVDAEGGRQPLQLDLTRVDADQLTRRTALAGGVVPPGTYVALELELVGATRQIDGAVQPLALLGPDEEPPAALLPQAAAEPRVHAVPVRVEVGRHDAVSLFLDWDVDASLLPGDWFRLALGLDLEMPQTRLGLLYVTDEASGSVLTVQRSTGQVAATIAVGEGPSAVALARNRRQLFVANGGDGSMSLVDTRENATLFTLPVRFGARTSDVVEAIEGRTAAVVNPGNDTLSIFDVRNAAKLGDVRVGRAPVRLAAASSLRRVYVANSLSDDVSVVDLNSLVVVASVRVESQPSAIAVDRLEREVFVAHRQSPYLLVIDADSLAVLERIHVGDDVTAVLPDRRRTRIFVSRGSPSELVVVERGLAAATRRIPVSGRIENLAQPPEGAAIYGAAPGLGGLVVIDVITGRELPLLPCGTSPTDVAAVD